MGNERVGLRVVDEPTELDLAAQDFLPAVKAVWDSRGEEEISLADGRTVSVRYFDDRAGDPAGMLAEARVSRQALRQDGRNVMVREFYTISMTGAMELLVAVEPVPVLDPMLPIGSLKASLEGVTAIELPRVGYRKVQRLTAHLSLLSA